MMSHPEKIEALRSAMNESNLDAYLIPTADPHLGEYIPDYWKIIPWLTGFTGSAATVIVTPSFAGLWTDSRYVIQARNQLMGSGCTLMEPEPEGDGPEKWLKKNAGNGKRVGVDGRIFSISRYRKAKSMPGAEYIFDTEADIISDIWIDRPALVSMPAFEHPVAFCGKERKEKIDDVRKEMGRLNVNYQLLNSTDDIMWLLNIRGKDYKYSPLFTSFALIGEEQVMFFCDEVKVPFKLAREFDSLGIIMLPYEDAAGMLSTLSAEETILFDPATTSTSFFNSITKGMKMREGSSIPSLMKSVKNSIEIKNLGNSMIRDGVALTRFFFWIEQNSGSVPMSELSLAEKLSHLRSEQENFLGLSFPAIIAFNEHAALPHYSATSETDSVIGSEGILLVDSGGQYLDGTTDITRTIALGKPGFQVKKDYTLVLKGHIGLANVKFPSGTKGYQLDTIARKALWENGLNFGHGTGHGVGFCLNVHESPPSISPSVTAGTKTSFEPGMLVSNEPGIYREGEYGIRTENLILCYEDEETESGKFLKFETASLCYIDKNLIQKDLLDEKEIRWLNSYHLTVYEKLSPYLNEDEKKWLGEKTSELI